MKNLEELMDYLSRISNNWTFSFSNNKYTISANKNSKKIIISSTTLYDGLNEIIDKIEN